MSNQDRLNNIENKNNLKLNEINIINNNYNMGIGELTKIKNDINDLKQIGPKRDIIIENLKNRIQEIILRINLLMKMEN